TSWPGSSWCPSCSRTKPRPPRSPPRCSRCCATRRPKSGKLRGSTIFITCCAGTRRKGPPRRCSRCSIMAMPKLGVCGVDEAGRGPLAGPVYAAAVILNPARRINGLADSKLLAPERREVLAGRIKERAIAWAIARASVEEIDRLNTFRASLRGMPRAVETLAVAPEEVWIDGRHCPEIGCRARAIVDGDALHPVISAASILAKTARDAEMTALHLRY